MFLFHLFVAIYGAKNEKSLFFCLEYQRRHHTRVEYTQYVALLPVKIGICYAVSRNWVKELSQGIEELS